MTNRELQALAAARTPRSEPRRIAAAMHDLNEARCRIRSASSQLDARVTRREHRDAMELMDRIDNLMTNLSEWGE